MDRGRFWSIAQETLKEVLSDFGKEQFAYEAACKNMHWQVVDEVGKWGIMFVTGRGPTGMFSIYVDNRLCEAETKQEFKRELLRHIERFP